MLLEEKNWEEMIAINTRTESVPVALKSAEHYFSPEDLMERHKHLAPDLPGFLRRDKYPLPTTVDREGYYGDQHFNFWMSGLYDYLEAKKIIGSKKINQYLDFGAATGRVSRHFAAQENNIEVICADINLKHVRWVNKHLGENISAFQNSSIPHLPFEDCSFDLVTAYSVFSHIEVFDHSWLYEIRRILRPGGRLIFTANVDNWQDIEPSWPVYKALKNHPMFDNDDLGKPLKNDKEVFRWNNSGSYSSVVFMTSDYLKQEWGKILKVDSVIPFYTGFQTGVSMVKEG